VAGYSAWLLDVCNWIVTGAVTDAVTGDVTSAVTNVVTGFVTVRAEPF
jgi:hypothetical protein